MTTAGAARKASACNVARRPRILGRPHATTLWPHKTLVDRRRAVACVRVLFAGWLPQLTCWSSLVTCFCGRPCIGTLQFKPHVSAMSRHVELSADRPPGCSMDFCSPCRVTPTPRPLTNRAGPSTLPEGPQGSALPRPNATAKHRAAKHLGHTDCGCPTAVPCLHKCACKCPGRRRPRPDLDCAGLAHVMQKACDNHSSRGRPHDIN